MTEKTTHCPPNAGLIAALGLGIALIAALLLLLGIPGTYAQTQPTIASVSPNTFAVGSQDVFTITGSSFEDTPTVTVDSQALVDVGFVTATTLTATVPSGLPVGTYTVTVMNPGGLSDSLPDGLTVQNPTPAVQGLTPVSTTYGQVTTLTITGTGFIATPALSLDGASCAAQYVNSTTVTTTVPGDLAPGVYTLTVQNPGPGNPQDTMPDAFTIHSPVPLVTSCEPRSAANDLDTQIVITGAGFAPTPTVSLGPTPLEQVTWVSLTRLTALVPWGMDEGSYALTITNPNPGAASAVLPSAFTATQGINGWNTGGPYGGIVNGLALGESDYKTVYATVHYVGLFRSRDGGSNWEHMFNGTAENQVSVDPFDLNRIYIARRPEGLYRSDDGGDTWNTLPSPSPDAAGIYQVAVSPHDRTLFVARSAPVCDQKCGLFSFDETAQTWQRLQTADVLTEATGVTSIGFDPIDPQLMYASTQTGIVIKSNDGGQTWSSMGQTPLPYIARLSINPIGVHEPWICGGLPMYKAGGLYKYSGGNWVRITATPDTLNDVYWVIFDPDATDPDHQTIWIAAGNGVMKSENGGQDWSYLNQEATAVALDPAAPQVIYSGSREGVEKTEDGGNSWQSINQGLTGVIPGRLAVSAQNPAIVYGAVTSIGIFGSANGGNSWERLTDRSGGPITIDPNDAQHVVMFDGVDVFTADDGRNFTRTTSIPLPPGMDEQHYTVRPSAVVARDDLWLMGVMYVDMRPATWEEVSGGIYTSIDGENWEWVDPGRSLYRVMSVGFDPVYTNTWYATTGADGRGTAEVFVKTTDGGQTWQQSIAGLPESYAQGDTSMAIEPVFPYRIALINGTDISISYDRGASWIAGNHPDMLTYRPFGSILFTQEQPSVFYAATSAGLFRSLDGAETWRRAAGELGELDTWSMATVTTDDRVFLYVATVGGTTGSSTAQPLDQVDDGATVDAGVYRNTILRLTQVVYLPIVTR